MPDTEHSLPSWLKPGAINGLWVLAFMASAAFLYTFTYNDLSVGFTSDDAVYLLLADLYSFNIEPSEVLFYDFVRKESYFPPLYPMVLGLFGGNSLNPGMAGMITVTQLLVAVFIAGFWINKVSESHAVSACATVFMVLMPGTLVLSQELWSEFQFMLFVYTALLLGNKASLQGQDWMAMALLIALASFTRSIGISLAIAFCLVLFYRHIKHRLVYSFIAFMPFLYWNVIREQFVDRSDYFATFLSGFSGYSLQGIFDMVSGKAVSLFLSFRWLFTNIESSDVHGLFAFFILSIILILIVCTLYRRTRQMKMDAMFVVAYIAIVFVWPFDNVYFYSRFIYPLVPIFLLYAIIGAGELPLDGTNINRVLVFFVASIIIISIPSQLRYIHRAYMEVEPELEPHRRNRQWLMAESDEQAIDIVSNSAFIISSLRQLPEVVPGEQCIYATQSPLVMLYTKRITGVYPSAETDMEEFFRQTSICRYFLFIPALDTAGQYPSYYPFNRLNNENYKISAYFENTTGEDNTQVYLFERI